MTEKADSGVTGMGGGGDLFRAVAESTPDAIFVKDLEGRYLLVNTACARFIGLPADEIVGRRDEDLYPPETARRFTEDDRAVVESGETRVFEGVASGAGGTQVYRVTKGVVRGAGGAPVAVFGISHDMTERLRAEEERARRAEAEEASRLKDEFLATLGHELRTPLTSIIGWVHLIRGGHVEGEAAAVALETVERNALAQAQLIDDLLDVSRIVAGKLSVEPRPVLLSSVVESAAASLRPTADAKGLDLSVESGPAHVLGDPDRLQQVVWNLLSNAVKFTPRGGRVAARVYCRGGQACVEVRDTGRGIPAEFLPHVFDRFRQEDQSTTREHGGLGLGLSIVRHIVELHGGGVRAESAGEGRGATLTVEIPLAPAPSPPDEDAGPAAGAETAEKSLRGVRVLVVDDDDSTRRLVETLLGSRGADVVTARSAPQAFDLLRRERFDVLLADIGMTGEDGYSLIRRVRALRPEEGGHTPAAALTAYARPEDRAAALEAGFQLHVAKPADPAEVVAAVASLAARGHVG